MLLKSLAVLFPDVYKYFTFLATNEAKATSESEIRKTFPKRYLLGCITSFFGKHIVCQCKQRQHGVLLYRRGTDLGYVLSKTLHLLQKSSTTLLGFTNPEEDDETQLFSFCNSINKRVHQQIRATTSRDAQTPYDISSFDLQSCIDPILWKVVLLITRSVRENQKQTTPENITHQRKLQCLYTLCVILFNTNRTCSVPLHVLLTDLVESQGGSSELVHLLNSVGAIASVDTHQRHVQFYIERKREQGILSELNMENFTVVSVDNIDFLQRHAYVYCGDQSRSWHGTTVQAVQPMLNTMCDTSGDSSLHRQHNAGGDMSNSGVATNMQSPPIQMRKRTAHPTPNDSPSTRSPALKKVSRRARTAKEARATHYHNPTCPSPRRALFSFTHATNPLQGICMNHYSALRNMYTISHFRNSSMENTELNTLKRACFMYMLMTSDPTNEHVKCGSFLTFLKNVFPVEVTPSHYHYLDVLDQNADCRETICDILSGLHKQFDIGISREHLVVAGDAKTYQHLQSRIMVMNYLGFCHFQVIFIY